MAKTRRDRTFSEYLSDPNPTGAFVGGPPLLSEKDMRRLMEATGVDERASIALKKIQTKYAKATAPAR